MQSLDLITCIIQRGKADKIVKKALQEGAQGATIYYSRGTGVRQKLGIFGSLIQPEKEVILIVMTISALSLKIYDFNNPVWNRRFFSMIWPIASGVIMHVA